MLDLWLTLAITACRGEYTNLSQEARETDFDTQAKASKQEEDNSNPDAASRGDKRALDGATQGQEGLDNQPSLAFFPADQTGYIAKVGRTTLPQVAPGDNRLQPVKTGYSTTTGYSKRQLATSDSQRYHIETGCKTLHQLKIRSYSSGLLTCLLHTTMACHLGNHCGRLQLCMRHELPA